MGGSGFCRPGGFGWDWYEYQQRQAQEQQLIALKGDAIMARQRLDGYEPQSGGGGGLLRFLGGAVVLVLALALAYKAGLLSEFESKPKPPSASLLTLEPNRDYAVVAGRLREASAATDGDLPQVESTTQGLKLSTGTQAVLLPRAVHGTLETCLRPGRASGVVRYAGRHVVPWSALAHGRQLCLLPAASNVSLISVQVPHAANSTLVVVTWLCARPKAAAGSC